MKKYMLEFVRRGLTACGLGPIILAVIYLALNRCAGVESLTVGQVCTGIFSSSALAFAAGGINVIYQLERLPLMVAILIHGGVLYVSYLGTYLLNDWLQGGAMPFLIFSLVFVFGYFVIWAVIYGFIRHRTQKINEILKQKQQKASCCD